MGIVFKQSLKNIISSYAGFGIGAVNVLLLYPNFMRQDYYGLVTFLLSAGSLVWPIMAFGTPNSLVKFYSFYKTKSERDKLMSMNLLLPLIVGATMGLLAFVFHGFILEYFNWKGTLVGDYLWLIFIIAISIAYFELFFAWGKTQMKSVFGNFMREVFHRICTSILLILVYFSVIDMEVFFYLLTSIYVLRTFVMAVYAFVLYFPKITFQFPTNKTRVLKYSFLMFIAGSVAMVMLDLDKVMIEPYMTIENVAIYGIAIYIASVIAVPSRAMHQITYPMTASILNRKDRAALKDLYKRSSESLLVVGGLIFLLIVCNVHQLYQIIPEEYRVGMSVVFLISVVKLYDNLLGNANSILYNSDYYRWVLFSGVFLALTAFVLNIWLIPKFGIYGAAYATFIAFFAYNSLKLFLVQWKFGLSPFTSKTLLIIIGIATIGLGFYFWEFPWHPLANIFLKSTALTITYMLFAHLFKVSEDISELIDRFFKRRQ